MSDVGTIILALVVSVVAPLVLLLGTNHAARRLKQQDWDREDIVAERAAAAMALLATGNELASKKLDVIHTLVNSDMTRALEGQLAALEAQRILLLDDDTSDRTAAVESVAEQIEALKTTLADRAEQTALADMQIVQVQRAEEAVAELTEVEPEESP